MFDGDFILARRTFLDVDDRAVAEALVADGFEPLGMVGFSKECCGAYDAVWADVLVSDAEGTVVELTAADSDWQLAWPLYSGAGSLIALVGVGVLVSGLSSRREQFVAEKVALSRGRHRQRSSSSKQGCSRVRKKCRYRVIR